MKIIVGLGNPGLKYRKTRHNAGFMALGALAKKCRLPIKKKGFSGRYGIGRLRGHEILLFEPMTFMNLSGEAVAAVCSSKLENTDELLIVTDDVDIPLGSIRLRKSGSSGGHNGLKSIIGNIGSDFARLRIGVGQEDPIIADTADFVLSRFPRRDIGTLNKSIEEAVSCIETWVTEGVTPAMNRFN